jgi:hypothetical protein
VATLAIAPTTLSNVARQGIFPYGNINQASGGGSEGQQKDQDAQIKENPLPCQIR